jgi:hypothetical protein
MAENLRKDEARALSKQEDLTLISRALENDQSAYQSLMKKYKRLVQNLVYKMISNKDDVEDLTQKRLSRHLILWKNLTGNMPSLRGSIKLHQITA